MLLLLQLNTLFFLFFIFWEDQHHLALPIWLFFPLILNWVGLSFFQTNSLDWAIHGILNTLFVTLALLLLYFFAVRRYGYFINKVFGLGDVLFLYIFAWAYPAEVFISIWLAGTLASIIIARMLKHNVSPYAGNLALFNFIILLSQLFPIYPVNLYDYSL